MPTIMPNSESDGLYIVQSYDRLLCDYLEYNKPSLVQPSYHFIKAQTVIVCILIIENPVHHMTDYVTTYLTSAVRLPSSYITILYNILDLSSHNSLQAAGQRHWTIAFFLYFNSKNSATILSKLMLLVKTASMVKRDKSHILSWPTVERSWLFTLILFTLFSAGPLKPRGPRPWPSWPVR